MSPEKLKNILSKNLKKIRKDLNLSQFALAEKADVSEDTIKSIELMRQWPSEKTLAQIAEALGVEVFQLFLPDSKNFPIEPNSAKEIKKLIAKNIKDYVNDILEDL